MSQLLKKFESVMAESKTAFHNFPWEDAYAYAMWLQQTFYFVENSTRLVALTGARFPTSRNDFHRRFMEHCAEEMGHEKLLIHDIKALKLGPIDLPVLPQTQVFYQTQYYWIDRVDPIAFYGYLLYLEGLAAHHASHAIERVKAKHGPSALTFLKLHAEEDEGHIEKAFETIMGKTSAQEEGWIIQNMETCCFLYTGFMADIAARYSSKHLKKTG